MPRRSVDCTRRGHAILAQSGHEGDRLPMTLWRKVHQSLAAGATAVQPHHLGIGRGLIDEHQPGRIEQALFAHPTSACPRYVRALLLCRAQTFFERDLVSWKKPPNRRPTARNLVLVHRADDLGSTSISASKKS